MAEEDGARLNDIAIQIALAEILRRVIAEAFYSKDENEFRKRLSRMERATTDGLAQRRLFPQANAEAAEAYIKEVADAWIANFFASILHPKSPRDDLPE